MLRDIPDFSADVYHHIWEHKEGVQGFLKAFPPDGLEPCLFHVHTDGEICHL
jgi:hypothetical protein